MSDVLIVDGDVDYVLSGNGNFLIFFFDKDMHEAEHLICSIFKRCRVPLNRKIALAIRRFSDLDPSIRIFLSIVPGISSPEWCSRVPEFFQFLF